MIHPLLPNQLQKTQETMRMAAEFILRPISRKYDKAEHEPPLEMEQLNQAAAAQKKQTGMTLKSTNFHPAIRFIQTFGSCEWNVSSYCYQRAQCAQIPLFPTHRLWLPQSYPQNQKILFLNRYLTSDTVR